MGHGKSSEIQLACEYLYTDELGQQGEIVVTSPQIAAMIGWDYAGGACLDHILSECFASVGAKKNDPGIAGFAKGRPCRPCRSL